MQARRKSPRKGKLIVLILSIVFFSFLGAASVALAAGTTTQALVGPIGATSGIYELTFTWTADAAAATVPSLAINAANLVALKGKFCFFAITDPGATAPTDNYDISITDAYGVDVFNLALNNRDTANSEHVIPYVVTGSTSFAGGTVISDAWTFSLANNAVNSAVGILVLRFQP